MKSPAASARRFSQQWPLNGVLAVILVIIAIVIWRLFGASAPAKPVQTGMPAPDFTLANVRGGSVQLASLRGEPVLLAFINTQATGGEATAEPSRAQVNYLRSIASQYRAQGLRTIIIDGARSSTDALINYSYDMNLDDIPLLADPSGEIARSYGVGMLPTSFLIGADGQILNRWDQLALSMDLAFAIQEMQGTNIPSPIMATP